MDAFTLDQYLNRIRSLSLVKYNKMLKEHNLSLQEFKIITYLFMHKEDNTASKLAEVYDVTLPAIMHKTKILEEKGFLVKENVLSDNRKKVYLLTEKGESFCINNFNMLEDYTNKLLVYLGEDGVKFEEILQEIIKFMEVN